MANSLRGLWAVTVYEDMGGRGRSRAAWVVVAIYQRKDSAQNKARMIEGDHQRSYPLVAPKIYHPPRWVVESWLAAGNRIY
jgi:hypothetical protein